MGRGSICKLATSKWYRNGGQNQNFQKSALIACFIRGFCFFFPCLFNRAYNIWKGGDDVSDKRNLNKKHLERVYIFLRLGFGLWLLFAVARYQRLQIPSSPLALSPLLTFELSYVFLLSMCLLFVSALIRH